MAGLRTARARRITVTQRPRAERGRQDHLPAPALPLRAAEDRDVPASATTTSRSARPGCGGSSSASSMNRLPASQRYKRHDDRWKRYEKQLPGHRVQIDVKFIEPLGGSPQASYYQFTAIDDCTRLRVLRIYPRNNQKTAIQFLDYVLREAAVRASSASRPTTAPSSRPPSTGTCSTAASATSTSSPAPRGSTARSSDHTASTPRSSTGLLDGVVIDDAKPVQRQAPRVGGLLQLPPTPRRPRRPNPLRTPTR